MEDMHMTDFTISPKAENVWLGILARPVIGREARNGSY
ncbi:conserved domain protein (plasmid) [Yersinia pestis KIM D27]|nr:conserved domain protein [Yersinia pestis KIM D27]